MSNFDIFILTYQTISTIINFNLYYMIHNIKEHKHMSRIIY